MRDSRQRRRGSWAVGLLFVLGLPVAAIGVQEASQALGGGRMLGDGGAVAAIGVREASQEQADLIARGAEFFSRNCQRCHNPRGPAERNDRQWVIIMQHMQVRANMTRDRTRAVRAFLLASNETAQSPGAARGALPPAPAPAEITDAILSEGRRIYQTAGCAACHGVDLNGGPIAPSLRDANWNQGDGSLAAILRIVRNGVPGTAMAPYPGGISDEMAIQVAAYVWSVSQGRAER